MQSMLELEGGRGHGPPGKFLKIDAKILQFRDLSTYIKYFYSATLCCYIVCIYRKVSVSLNNHIMHLLTISSNRHVGAQHRFIMADNFKKGVGLSQKFYQLFLPEFPKNLPLFFFNSCI